MDNEYKYKISIVMSIYNVDNYIEKAINSIIMQNIGFESNIQLILVNDGSTDSSEEICLKYEKIYPNNIIYIKKKNGGLSSARNEGLKYVEGKYVNFLDPDDYLSKNVCKNVYKFFEENYNQIEFVSIPLYFFEAQKGLHPKYKYMKARNRIINLDIEPYNFILSSAACFYKNNIFNNAKFDDTMSSEEDTKFNFYLYKKNKCFGYVCDKKTKYHYRKRNLKNSTVDISALNPQNYYSVVNLLENILKDYKTENLPDYLEELVIYELRSRVKTIKQEIFKDKTEYNYLLDKFREYISKIEKIHIALKTKFLDTKQLKYIFLSNLNTDKNILKLNDNGFLTYENMNIFSITSLFVRINNIIYQKDNLIIDLFYFDFNTNSIEIVIQDNEQNIFRSFYDEEIDSSFNIKVGEFICSKSKRTKIKIPYKNSKFIIKILNKQNNSIYKIDEIELGRNSSFLLKDKKMKDLRQGYNIRFAKNKLIIKKNKNSTFKYNLWSFIYLYKKYKYKAYMRLFNKKNKKYILCNDRPCKGLDNGEALFEYINKFEKKIAKYTYFIIDKSSVDYKRIKNMGKIVIKDSIKHKFIFLNAKIICSSHLMKEFYCPYKKDKVKYYSDMLKYKFIWLQHGITINDISNIANKFIKGIDYLVCSTNDEYNEFKKEKYFYDKKDILLTGFPRFDKLYSKNNNIICIIPTWRNYLTGNISEKGFHNIKDGFENTEYFQAYKQVLSNNRLEKLLLKNNYILNFMLHPGMSGYKEYFSRFNNKHINVISLENANYSEIFAESKLLITDYSSILFDFAYLRKPSIYYQFDEDEFFNKHYKKGNFDYRRDGFGDVLKTHDELAEKIEYYFNNNFELEEKYLKRINKTFKYQDKDNCKRLMTYIKKIYNDEY